MPVFEQSVQMAGDCESVFALSQDYENRLAWDPFLRRAEMVGGESPAIGARAWCVAISGLGMETEYVAYSPPTVAAVKMTRGPWFLEQFAGSWRFDCISVDRTRVTFRYNVKGRPGALTPLLIAVFALDTRRRLMALKRAVEGYR